ncbi:MAG: heavy metal translocating P-type ATPase [Spirochaetota bacterium]
MENKPQLKNNKTNKKDINIDNKNGKESTLKIGGMTCAMCVKTIEKSLGNMKGVSNVNVNLSSENAEVVYDPDLVSYDDMKKSIENAGYQYRGVLEEETEKDKEEEERKHRKLLNSKLLRIITGFIVGIPLMVIMWTVPHSKILSYIMLAVSTPVFLYLSFPILKASFVALKNKNLDMNVMYSLGMGSAFIASVLSTVGVLSPAFMFYETPVMLATFLTFGKYLETRAKGKTSEAIKKLMGLKPKTATVIKDGKEVKTPLSKLQINDVIVVKPGEKVPTDGELIEGETYIDESMITGEPVPNIKKKGDKVIGATINKNSVIRIKATKIGKDTVLSQIIKLVREAQNSKPSIQKLADKVVNYFIPIILTIAIITFVVWFFILDKSSLFAFSRLISVLVIACPCALGLATPTAITVGIGRGAELGNLIKNGDALEISRKLNTVIFDKTGTLTTGKPRVTDIITYDIEEDELLSFAGSLENNSNHPLAEAVVNKAKENNKENNIDFKKVTKFDTYGGKGVKGNIADNEIYIGNRSLLKEKGINITELKESKITELENEGKTTILIAINKELKGIISIRDPLKDDTKLAIEQFKKAGIKVAMITGDNYRTANAIAKEIGIQEVLAEVMPDEKSSEVKKLQEKGELVAFIGDGINDAPALAQADVGIAIGSGTDVAMESGDIVLMKDSLLDAFYSVQLSKKVMTRIKQNLFWAFAYNTALVPVAAGVFFFAGITLKPEFAGLAMALSSVTVVTLSLLLKRYKPALLTSA